MKIFKRLLTEQAVWWVLNLFAVELSGINFIDLAILHGLFTATAGYFHLCNLCLVQISTRELKFNQNYRGRNINRKNHPASYLLDLLLIISFSIKLYSSEYLPLLSTYLKNLFTKLWSLIWTFFIYIFFTYSCIVIIVLFKTIKGWFYCNNRIKSDTLTLFVRGNNFNSKIIISKYVHTHTHTRSECKD